MKIVDGFPIQNSFSFLADSYPGINEWNRGKAIKIEVMDFYMNPRNVTWQDKSSWVADVDFFTMLIQRWIKIYKIPKDEATKEYFEMAGWT